ncbi:MAG TPA: hypothetical protein VK750_03320 [Cytophagaceae bacterium]|jgi:hypothetical protein|nr:hypothetical protein [Cytophagaceae bacterium]
MSNLIIRNWASVSNKEAVCNGAIKYRFRSEDMVEQKLEQLYRSLDVTYPKFFKMDTQSKLGWLCAEYVCEGGKVFEGASLKEVALVLSNKKSSLDTDEQYFKSLISEGEFLPSPAVFVYTLANIVAGEICIRHGIKGENNFLISERFDAEALFNYVTILFSEELCKQCLVGWVESYQGEMKAMLAFVEATTDVPEERLFTIRNLNQLYQTTAS